jgi:hypothetical protein
MNITKDDMEKKTKKTTKTTSKKDTKTVSKAVSKTTTKTTKKFPVITVGSHSVRTQHANGKVDFVVDDEKLRKDVYEAIELYVVDSKGKLVKKPAPMKKLTPATPKKVTKKTTKATKKVTKKVSTKTTKVSK